MCSDQTGNQICHPSNTVEYGLPSELKGHVTTPTHEIKLATANPAYISFAKVEPLETVTLTSDIPFVSLEGRMNGQTI